MTSIVKQSSWGLVANYVGILLGFVNVLLIMPAILEAEQIGLINLILSVVMIIYPILNFSSAHILKRYFTHVDDLQKIFNYSFLISCGGAILFAFVFFFGENIFAQYYQTNSPEVLQYFWWIYLVSIMMSWTDLIVGYATIYGKYHVTAFAKEILFRLLMTVILIGLWIKLFDFNTYIYLHFTLYGLAGFIILWLLYRARLFSFNWVLPGFSIPLQQRIFKFGSFTILTGLASVIAIRIDMVMLGSMEGLKDVSIYTIALYMATVIEVPRETILQASEPVIRLAIKEDDMDKVVQIHYKTILNLIVIGGFILAVLIANLDFIYDIIPNGDIYQEGFWVVFFIGLAKIVEMLGGSINEIINASKYYAYNILFVILLAGLSIGLNYFLIPIYGVTGAAAAAFFTMILVVVLKAILFKILFKKKVYKLALLWILVFYGCLGALLYYIPFQLHPILSIGIKSTIGGFMTFFFLKWTQVSPDLNNLINQILTSLKLDRFVKL